MEGLDYLSCPKTFTSKRLLDHTFVATYFPARLPFVGRAGLEPATYRVSRIRYSPTVLPTELPPRFRENRGSHPISQCLIFVQSNSFHCYPLRINGNRTPIAPRTRLQDFNRHCALKLCYPSLTKHHMQRKPHFLTHLRKSF